MRRHLERHDRRKKKKQLIDWRFCVFKEKKISILSAMISLLPLTTGVICAQVILFNTQEKLLKAFSFHTESQWERLFSFISQRVD